MSEEVDNIQDVIDRIMALSGARSLRLAIIFDQYKQGNITEDDAIELVQGALSPGKPETIIDDSRYMRDLIDAYKSVMELARSALGIVKGI